MALTDEQRQFLLGKVARANVRRIAGGAGGYSPSSAPGAQIYVDSNSGFTHSSGVVSAWDGLNGFVDGGNGPTWDQVVGGEVAFDGSNDDMNANSHVGGIVSDTAGHIMMRVRRITDGERVLCNFGNTATDSNRMQFYIRADGQVRIGNGAERYNNTVNIDDTAYHTVGVSSNGSRYLIYIDGTTYSITNGTDNGAWLSSVLTTPTNLTLGSLRMQAGS